MLYISLWFLRNWGKYVKQLCIYSFCYNNLLTYFWLSPFVSVLLSYHVIFFAQYRLSPINSCLILLANTLQLYVYILHAYIYISLYQYIYQFIFKFVHSFLCQFNSTFDSSNKLFYFSNCIFYSRTSIWFL